jgi:hypothetical protein
MCQKENALNETATYMVILLRSMNSRQHSYLPH